MGRASLSDTGELTRSDVRAKHLQTATTSHRGRLGGYVVGAWLLGIIVNLFLVGAHWDVLLRDFGLCLSAFALAVLSRGAAR